METEQNGSFFTFFYKETKGRIGSYPGLLPLSLYKGMHITVEGFSETFEVLSWRFHLGHPADDAGLHIELRAL